MKVTRHILSILLLSIITLTSFSQSTALRKADKFFNNYQYARAIKIYETLLKDNPQNIYLIKQLAHSNNKIGKYEESLAYFSKYIETPAASPEEWFQYAQLLKIAGKYPDAKTWFEKCLSIEPQNIPAQKQLQYLSEIDTIKGIKTFIVRRINDNTRFSDMSPFIFRDKLIFSSSRDTFSVRGNETFWNGQPFLDLFEAGYHKRVIYEVKKFSKALNSPFNEGPVSFSPDGHKIYVTRNNPDGKLSKGVNNLKIFIYEWDGKRWRNETEFPFNSNHYSVGHPAISKDGKTIYFVSNMPGGYGKTDIYQSNLTSSGWSKPENMGPEINTSENEMFPTIDPQGNLYFSSDGHPGLGGLDLFIAFKNGNNHFVVQNLGNTINSSYDDFSITYDETGEYGYFSSNRLYGEGSDDIYYFEIE